MQPSANANSTSLPPITVLTSIYNGMPYLPLAVESIQRQTWRDWTLLLINDGSTDGSADYLASLDDPRIQVVHQSNRGLAAALNRGIELCQTEFLARMDADDIALPTRLEKQLAFLRAHPAVGLVGSQIAPLGDARVGRGSSLPCDHRGIDANLVRGRHAVCHSSIMCRTALLREIGGYWPTGVSEDWDMYLRMAERAEMANVDEVLLHYRVLASGLQGRNQREIRSRIAYSCEAARRRRAGQPPIDYHQFCQSRRAAHPLSRAAEALDVYAMWQYRRALPEILGPRPFAGYARLGWAAACSPQLTCQRLWRQVRKRLIHRAPLHASSNALRDTERSVAS